VVYLPFISASQEVKSKPAQNAVRDLREAGIRCDILIARADVSVPSGVIKKLSLFSDISLDRVIAMPTVDTVYEVPLILEKQGVADTVCKQLGIKNKPSNIRGWSKLVDQIKKKDSPIVTVGVVAKYLDHTDTYASVVEALKSAAWNNGKQLKIKWIDAEKLNNKNIGSHVMGVQAMVVPGGFGSRGVEGKIIASQYALKNNLPYLGLCLGMQVACIGAVRLSGKKDANSTEFNPKTDNPVIDLMESQKTISGLGGTMRLGNYQCNIINNSLAHKLYKSTTIYERHRHRYEFNPKYLKDIESVGLTVSGKNPDTGLTEIIEAPKHKYFIASQFHPEFTSRPLRPHPLFDGLIKAAR
jgi:CTP synthase